MDVLAFLPTQPWLQSFTRPDQQPNEAQHSSKRTKTTRLACQTSFHVSMKEQYSRPTHWRGAKAKDVVFIRLLLPDGLFSSVMDVAVGIEQHGTQSSLVLEWYGSNYTIRSEHVIKVVCCPAVYAAMPIAQQPCVLTSSSCLLAQAAASDGRDMDYITLTTKHICLDIFAQHATEDLARIAAFLHSQAQCRPQATTPMAAAAAVSSANSIDNVLHTAHTAVDMQQAAAPTWSPPADAAQLKQWLSGASCEAKMLHMLLDSDGSPGQAQHKHLLQALGHLHASLKA